jgi:hypothetical protein
MGGPSLSSTSRPDDYGGYGKLGELSFLRHSSVHQGMDTRRGLVDDLEMWDSTARRREFVKYSSMESTDEKYLSSNATE